MLLSGGRHDLDVGELHVRQVGLSRQRAHAPGGLDLVNVGRQDARSGRISSALVRPTRMTIDPTPSARISRSSWSKSMLSSASTWEPSSDLPIEEGELHVDAFVVVDADRVAEARH